jgi:DnaD/phage-associated family protein
MFKNTDEKFYRYQKIMSSLGLHNRPIKKDEMQMIDNWFDGYNFSMEIVLLGCDTDKNAKPSIKYVNGTLTNWFEKGVKSVGDIELLDKPVKIETKQKSAPKKAASYKNRFHNFEQRSDKYTSEELEAIAKKKREAYTQRLKGEAKDV